ncbi:MULTISPECIES: hypothetical protein [Halorhodospira]|uniref:hypothetical protein n=1 Tax=Halorhodospira TaxID=85108 RepID=UPI001EE92084|nr:MULTISPECIES: hypothetical protein [Halorhodospira]MCG5529074.1 hypothetical protein [Halorhodospira halophila]MCG5543189.1 hypothetical protein [Halorhodospira sp. 9628]
MTSVDTSVELVVDRLILNRMIPKYQFERAVEPFLSLFIEEALERSLGHSLEFVVAELPLKKPNNAQSTNVDYLFREATGDWLLVELKTERAVVRPQQIEIYESRVGSLFRDVVSPIEEIQKASRQKKKYGQLLVELNKYRPHDGKINVMYVTPHKKSPIQTKSTKIQWRSFDDLFENFESKAHPELWQIVSRLVDAI